MIADLKANPEKFHSKKLEKQATLLSSMLKDLNINEIIGLADTEPNFLEIFGETEDQVSDWSNTTKYRIQDLMIRAYDEVSDRKASIQLSYPHLNSDVLCYQEFKRTETACSGASCTKRICSCHCKGKDNHCHKHGRGLETPRSRLPKPAGSQS